MPDISSYIRERVKPVTGRARICSASLKPTRRLIALGFHAEKEVCQHSHSSDPVPVHTIYCNILPYAIFNMWKYVYVYVSPRTIISALLVLLIPNTTANHAITY